jgi:hypothetical protein
MSFQVAAFDASKVLLAAGIVIGSIMEFLLSEAIVGMKHNFPAYLHQINHTIAARRIHSAIKTRIPPPSHQRPKCRAFLFLRSPTATARSAATIVTSTRRMMFLTSWLQDSFGVRIIQPKYSAV